MKTINKLKKNNEIIKKNAKTTELKYKELLILSESSKQIINALEYYTNTNVDYDIDSENDLKMAYKLVNKVYDKLFESLL